MKFSTRGRYALRVMLDLAMQDPQKYIPLKDISLRQNITLKYLEQIMPLLTRAGFVSSIRGNNGGYRLSRKPADYKIGDILRTTEGPLAPIPCLEEAPGSCTRASQCLTLPFWAGLMRVMNEYADSMSLQDLLPTEDDYTI